MSYLCVICNKEIIPKNKNKLKHHSYMKNLKYCSHFCSSYARRIGSNNIIYLNCSMCNKLIAIPKSRAKRLKQKGFNDRPIDIDLLPKILNELLFTTKTCKQIATELGIKPHTVAAISRGELFSELHNYNLPIR